MKLSEILEFDHVIHIDAAGFISDAPNDVYAPECYDPEPNATDAGGGWTLITSGLTGQYGYHGPWLHDSELLEGGVARHILEHAQENGGGLYVAVYAMYDEIDIEGWAIAYRPKDKEN